ncbi:MAG TPA: TonB-dependent receptor [Sedimentisphaerales bacterium]|nr:TonB-dependent receptor [Sedimentisphaerales bacterium]
MVIRMLAVCVVVGIGLGSICLGQNDPNQLDEVTELEDVVVTGTRTEKKLSDVPVRTELIKRTEIQETAARTLADAVEFTSGVRVENNCQNCNFSQLRLLGLEGPYSQILTNGLPLMSSLAAVYGIEHIPARSIERIEIVKGGGSALYGPGAVAGVVNVISRDPKKSGAEFETRYESVDGEPFTSLSGVADVVSENQRTRVSLLGQTDTQDAYDRNGDGFTELGERDMQFMGFRLRQSVGMTGDLSLDYSHLYEDRRGGNDLDLPEFMADTAESVQTTRDTGILSWSDALSAKFDYRLTGSFALTDRDSYYGAGMDPNAYGGTDNPMYVLDSQFNHYLDAHTLTWGAQYSSETLEDEQPAYDRFTDDRYTNLGFYVQDDWAVTDTLSFIPGARIDKHSEIDDPIVSPRMAIKWSPREALAVRASYAAGFRAPQVFDEDLHITQVGGEGQVIRNADDLEEERSDSYTLGAEWTPRVGPGYALAEVTGFYTTLEDSFFLDEQGDPATPDQELVRINRGGARVYGAEFNTGYKINDRFETTIGYVLQNSQYDDREDDFGSRDFFRTPDDYGVLKFTWRNPKVVDVFVGAKYTGDMLVPHYAGFIGEDRLETTDSFLTWDVSLSKRLVFKKSELTAQVGVKNLTDEYQNDLDEGPDRDAGYVYGPRMPRTYFASLKYMF